MAVTVLNSPTTPNVTKTKLVYTISGSNINQPQYQYVTDIYESGSTTLLTRLYTYPNLQGSGIVDIARVLDDNLDYDNFWQVTGSLDPVQAVKTFDIRFGEAYGTSISSSVTIYTGSSANYIQVFPGTVDPNQGSFNFNTSSYNSPSQGNLYLTNCPAALTDSPIPNLIYAYSLNSTDYFTLTLFDDGYSDPDSIRIQGAKLENGVATLVTSSNFNLTPPSGAFNTIGIGPQNLSDWDSGWANYFASGSINVLSTTNDPGGVVIYINDLWDGIPTNTPGFGGLAYQYLIPEKKCSDEYTRFAWINKLGFWDYYNVYNPTRKATNVQRNTFDKPNVDYSSTTSIYSVTRRGEKQYNTGYIDNYEITTDYIDKPTADWLTELFDSPEVYVQENANFIPVVIENSTYEWNMNQNRQKLFQFTINYRYANKRYDR